MNIWQRVWRNAGLWLVALIVALALVVLMGTAWAEDHAPCNCPPCPPVEVRR